MDNWRERTLKTAARYLGVRGEIPPLLEDACGEMLAVAAPRHVLRREAARTEPPLFHFGNLPPIPSKNLCRLFAGCREGCALLATLGMELDLRVRRLMVTSPGLAAAVGACGSAYVDVYIDEFLRQEAAREGLVFTPRFSPGYGDVSLSIQPALLRLLDARRLGVSLTEGFLMLPEKSVTAFFGVAGANQTREERHESR